MESLQLESLSSNQLRSGLVAKTAIITGGAGGIGGATARLFNFHGANVVLADLESTRDAAEALISTFSYPSRAIFLAASVADWQQSKQMFKETIARFGTINIVVANAGIMESQPVLNVDSVESDGDPKAPVEAFNVIDVNLKGTFNTLKLALHYLKNGTPSDTPGSVILVASTSGYFGGSGVTAYVASKHGVVGLLRASQLAATQCNIRVNGIAPSLTPTAITRAYSTRWIERGLESNTPEAVATAIAQIAVDQSMRGTCTLIAGGIRRELELTRAGLNPLWIGDDATNLFMDAANFFDDIGGYPLPPS